MVEINPSCGIYRITCIPTGKCYIGSSKDIPFRYMTHFQKLRANTHPSIKFQHAFDKYGADNFELDILKLCREERLLHNEQKYFDLLKPELNMMLNAFWGTRGTRSPIEIRQAISDACKRRKELGLKPKRKPHSEETKAKISAAQKGKPRDYARIPCSEEKKAKISAAHMGMVYPDRRGKKRPQWIVDKAAAAQRGRKASPEARENMRQAQLRYNARRREERSWLEFDTWLEERIMEQLVFGRNY